MKASMLTAINAFTYGKTKDNGLADMILLTNAHSSRPQRSYAAKKTANTIYSCWKFKMWGLSISQSLN